MSTALVKAVRSGDIQAVATKLQELTGSNEGSSKRMGEALVVAACSGYKDIVSLLVQSGASIDQIDSHNFTPLMWAACKGHVKVVQLLIEAKADVNKTARRLMVTQSGRYASPGKIVSRTTALLLAATHGHADVVELLVANAGANLEIVGTGNAPICMDEEEDDDDEEETRQRQQQQNHSNGEGTALLFAARNNHVEVVKILLAHGANISAPSRSQFETPLHKACHKGHLETTRLLLSKGADVRSVDSCSLTALHKACSEGHIEVAKLLISHDADVVNARDDKRDSPLHYCISFGHNELARLLLNSNNRVEIDACNENQESPLLMAIQKGQMNPERLDVELIELLIQHGASVNIKNKQEEAPLHVCVATGSIPLLMLLLKSGADPCVKDNRGMSPLDRAKRNGGEWDEMINLLTEAQTKAEEEQVITRPLSPGKGALFLRQLIMQAQIDDEPVAVSYVNRLLTLGYHNAYSLKTLVEQEKPDSMGRRVLVTWKVVHRNRFIQEVRKLPLPELDLEKCLPSFLADLLYIDEATARAYAGPVSIALGCERGKDLCWVDWTGDILPLDLPFLEGHGMALEMFIAHHKDAAERQDLTSSPSDALFLGGSESSSLTVTSPPPGHQQSSSFRIFRGISDSVVPGSRRSSMDFLLLPEHSSSYHSAEEVPIGGNGHRGSISMTTTNHKPALTRIPWPQAELHWLQLHESFEVVDRFPDSAARAGLIRLDKILQSLVLENRYSTLSDWNELAISKAISASQKGGGIGQYMNELRKKCALSIEDFKMFEELDRYRLLRNHFAHDDGVSFKLTKAREVLVFASRMLLEWAAESPVPDQVMEQYHGLCSITPRDLSNNPGTSAATDSHHEIHGAGTLVGEEEQEAVGVHSHERDKRLSNTL